MALEALWDPQLERRGVAPLREATDLLAPFSIPPTILKGLGKNFRFQFWPWHYLGRSDYPAAFSDGLQAENFRFCPFWEIAWE